MTGVVADPVAETRRILAAADAAAVPLRALGGIAVAMVAPTVARLQPTRSYHDIDLAAVARSGTPVVSRLLTGLGYEAARRFNTLNGSERLLFHDPDGRRVDVFVDTLRMCHVLPFAARIESYPSTLSPADLVLSKLQIVELTGRDAQDLLALFADLALTESDADGIGVPRIREVCGADWGWWRTVDDNLRLLSDQWQVQLASAAPETARVFAQAIERASDLRRELATCPKTVGWRIRARVGARLHWYESPEEVR